MESEKKIAILKRKLHEAQRALEEVKESISMADGPTITVCGRYGCGTIRDAIDDDNDGWTECECCYSRVCPRCRAKGYNKESGCEAEGPPKKTKKSE